MRTDDEIRKAVILATNYEPGNNWWLSMFIGGTEEVSIPDRCDAWYCDNRPATLHKDHGFLCKRHMEEMRVYTVQTETQFNLSH